MMKTLTLLIPSDWPEQRRDCPWLLRDALGHLIEQGCSEPAHWPIRPSVPQSHITPAKAGRTQAFGDEPLLCDMVLCGEQVSGHAIQLPKTALGRSPEVIAAALEDCLLEDGAQTHFSVRPSPAAEGELSTVGVVSKLRLMEICQVLKPLGLQLRSAWPLSLCLPPDNAALMASELTLPLPKGGFVTLDISSDLSVWLDTLGRDNGSLPLRCVVLGQQMAPENELRLKQSAAGHLQLINASDLLTIPAGAGFLYGELAPPRRPSATLRDFRMAARLATGFALAATLLSALQWGWLNWQAKKYRQDIESSFRVISPQGALVDPLLQMQRQVDTALHAAGQLGAGDFLRLIEPLAGLPANQAALQEISYVRGRLRIAGQLDDDDLQALKQDYRRLGLTFNVLAQDKQASGIRVDLEISEGIKR